MTEQFITLDRVGDIAFLTIDNAPVNALGHAVRRAFIARLNELSADDGLRAIVICGAGGKFIGGADISEFDQAPREPHFPTVMATIEAHPLPILAMIEGHALGGGLEVALACRWRIATATAKLGLPEVTLGLLPGAGGTVRLPRLIGPPRAIEMIVTGRPVTAAQARTDGLIDAVVEGDPRAAAVTFLNSQLAAGDPPKPLAERTDMIDDFPLESLDDQIAGLLRKSPGLDAPAACAEAVRRSLTLPFGEALDAERAAFLSLKAGDQSRALRHLFFAERTAAKAPDLAGVKPQAIETVGIVGAGLMGSGIAMAFANAGFGVTVVDINAEVLERGRAGIERTYATSLKRGSLTEAEMQTRLARISFASRLEDLAACDLVVEAVFEDMAVKKDIFSTLDTILAEGAIMASNTSFLDIDEIARSTRRPEALLGLHFFSPANVMKLVEVVRGARTDTAVLATAINVSRKLGKMPVLSGVCHGFIGNRLIRARATDIVDLLLEGATPARVDQVLRDFGWPMGPFQMMDLAGLDINWRSRQSTGQALPIVDDLYEQGNLGQKTGKGFYAYLNGSRKGVIYPEIVDLISDKSAEMGIARRSISDEEIFERTHFPLINEGARIIEEGIAARWSDIDVVLTHGYGFPRGKGGPMHWAVGYGLSTIVERLDHWHEVTGKPIYAPSPLLVDSARSGRLLSPDDLSRTSPALAD